MARRHWGKEKLWEWLVEATRELGRAPTAEEMNALEDAPSDFSFRYHWGSLRKAQEAAEREVGLKEPDPPLPESKSEYAKSHFRLHRALEKAKDLSEVFREVLVEEIRALPVPGFKVGEHQGLGDPEPGVLVLSDWHGGEKVTRREVLGRRGFDIAQLEIQAGMVVDSVGRLVRIARSYAPMSELLVLLLGDLITGESIYPGQQGYIDLTLLQQVLRTGAILAQTLNALTELVPRIRVETTAGNHGRLGRRGDYHHESNVENLLYYMVQLMLKDNPRIEMDIHLEEVFAVEWGGHVIAAGHGAELLRGSSANTETAMKRAASDWPDLLGRMVDTIVIGHFHVPDAKEIGEKHIFINGSMVGGNYYSTSKFRVYTPPYQLFLGMHPKRITWRRLIDFVGGSQSGNES